MIQDNDTKTAISSYLKKAICYELPLQVVDICKRTIDAYVGVLMDLAGSELVGCFKPFIDVFYRILAQSVLFLAFVPPTGLS